MNQGPRVTLDDIEANIASEHYFTGLQGARMAVIDNADDTGVISDPFISVLRPELGLLTFCVLILRNGYTVVGKSACVSPENFDAQKGREIARADALNGVWPLMGYALRSAMIGDGKGSGG